MQSIKEIYTEIKNCTACRLGIGNTNRVLMKGGNTKTNLMFIGEAPGRDEDRLGEPFVGRAGKKLIRVLESYSIKRKDIWIENILHCRPPNNRRPKEDEIDICVDYLIDIICVIKPKVIVTLGKTATNTVLYRPYEEALIDIRGKFKKFSFDGTYGKCKCFIIPTWHPSYVLRNLGKKVEEEFKTDILKACIRANMGKGAE